jgi:hypothetical protein
MINCVFIQTNEPMLERQKFICTFETTCTTGAKFRHPNFGIKEGTIHLVFPLFLVLLHCKKNYRFFIGEDEGKY